MAHPGIQLEAPVDAAINTSLETPGNHLLLSMQRNSTKYSIFRNTVHRNTYLNRTNVKHRPLLWNFGLLKKTFVREHILRSVRVHIQRISADPNSNLSLARSQFTTFKVCKLILKNFLQLKPTPTKNPERARKEIQSSSLHGKQPSASVATWMKFVRLRLMGACRKKWREGEGEAGEGYLVGKRMKCA
jgi:hypothetical protein